MVRILRMLSPVFIPGGLKRQHVTKLNLAIYQSEIPLVPELELNQAGCYVAGRIKSGGQGIIPTVGLNLPREKVVFYQGVILRYVKSCTIKKKNLES